MNNTIVAWWYQNTQIYDHPKLYAFSRIHHELNLSATNKSEFFYYIIYSPSRVDFDTHQDCDANALRRYQRSELLVTSTDLSY